MANVVKKKDALLGLRDELTSRITVINNSRMSSDQRAAPKASVSKILLTIDALSKAIGPYAFRAQIERAEIKQTAVDHWDVVLICEVDKDIDALSRDIGFVLKRPIDYGDGQSTSIDWHKEVTIFIRH